jgi:hypothetical protein
VPQSSPRLSESSISGGILSMPVLVDVLTLALTPFLPSQVRRLGRVIAWYLASDTHFIIIIAS